jgi:tetratricopeptide (TPR) repeat protein
MVPPHASILPPPNPEHRRVAAGQFERANQVVATGNFDYGIRLLISCCKLDPANLVYRQSLRRTEKAKYRNNLRGSWFAWLTAWPVRAKIKAAMGGRDYLKVLEHGEQILMRNPWDVGAQMTMAEAADTLGLLDLAIWNLEQARQKQPRDPVLNRALARLYEKRGNFTQAMGLWDLIRKARPEDAEASNKIKNLAADDTIARGQYQAVLSGAAAPSGEDTEQQHPPLTPTPPPPTKGAGPRSGTNLGQQRRGPGSGRMPRPQPPDAPGPDAAAPGNDRVAREAAPLRTRLEADPTNANLYLQLAALYRRSDQLDQAHEALRQGLGPTGNAFELTVELADLEIEPFRRNLAITEEKLQAEPDNEDLRKIRLRLRKEVNTRELEVFRQKADRYPTEMGLRYEVGVRLLRAGQIDEAIRELQAARADMRCRAQALLYLGHCFKARNNWRLAQRNFEEALQHLPAGETVRRKELLFELASGCADAGDLAHAVDLGMELVNLDFGYREVNRLLDQWQARLHQANVSQ